MLPLLLPPLQPQHLTPPLRLLLHFVPSQNFHLLKGGGSNVPFLTPFAVLSCGPEDSSKAPHPRFRERLSEGGAGREERLCAGWLHHTEQPFYQLHLKTKFASGWARWVTQQLYPGDLEYILTEELGSVGSFKSERPFFMSALDQWLNKRTRQSASPSPKRRRSIPQVLALTTAPECVGTHALAASVLGG